MKIRNIIKLLSMLMFLILVGCASNQTGQPINYTKLQTLTLGYATQDDVKQVMGYPQRVLYEGERTIYQYRFDNGDSSDQVRQAVDLVFNKQQRLIDITINDALLPNKQEVLDRM